MPKARYLAILLMALSVASLLIATGVASGAPASVRHRTAATNITGSGATAHFVPADMKVSWSGARSNHEVCKASNTRIEISNETKVSQTVLFGSKALATLAPRDSAEACFFGKGSRTFTFRLKSDKTAKLTVHVS